MLWKITSKNEEIHPSYLFGTMHAAPASILPKIEGLYPCLEKCQIFAAETDISRGQEVAEAVSFLQGTNLRILLGKKKFDKFRSLFLKVYKIDLLRFLDFNPLFLNSLLTRQAFGSIELIAPDELLWEKATELGLEMKGLETVEQEIEIIKKLPMKYQVNSLKSIGVNVTKYRRKLLELSQLYAAEELSELYKRTIKGTGGMKKLLLYDRNETMTESFLFFAKKASLFAAVGAAHLPGKKGILKMLKDEGAVIQPIKISG